jgi:8-oxo-dGTP pyrophosphatase MutT (NUDIX family)
LSGNKRRPKAFLACYLVLIREGKILLSRRANTGFQDGKYSMVAGHLEDRETVWDAIVREAEEEAGLTLDPKGLRIVHVSHRQDIDREYVDFYVMSDTKEEPRNLEPEKCDDLGWFDVKNPPKNVIPYVRAAIDCINRKEFYSESIISS